MGLHEIVIKTNKIVYYYKEFHILKELLFIIICDMKKYFSCPKELI